MALTKIKSGVIDSIDGVVIGGVTPAAGSFLALDSTSLSVAGNIASTQGGTAALPKITLSGSTTTGIYTPAANAWGVSTNGIEALTIDASQNVGIGTTSPTYDLAISNNNNETIDFRIAAAAGLNQVIHYDRTGLSYVTVDNAAAEHRFTVDTQRAVTIDSSGNVGIGSAATTPAYILEVVRNDAAIISIKDSGASSLTATDGKLRIARSNDLEFGALKTVGGSTDLVLGTSFVGGELSFETNANNEAMRIESSGNLLVNRTVAGSGVGFEVNTAFGGYIQSASTSISSVFDRLSTDGTITEFRKDGAPVGSMGTFSGRPYFANTAGNGIRISSGYLSPSNGTGGNADATLDLGSSSDRFKSLYLSGGVYLGGTGAGDLLDDYQDKIITTVTLVPSGSGTITLDASADDLASTKVGSLVTVTGQLTVASVSSPVGASISIIGLPYTLTGLTGQAERTGFAVVRINSGTRSLIPGEMTLTASSEVRLEVGAATVDSTDRYRVSFSYFTDD